MRVLLVGAGGVGTAVTRIAARRPFFDAMVVADYDLSRAEAAVAALGADAGRFSAVRLDASDEEAVVAALRAHACDVLLNATDPRFVLPLFHAARAAGANYLDMAMSLSRPHPERPYEECGVKLGDAQFEDAAEWEKAGALALV
ncbi:saccharopine dehydrogenase NADP-binding domain-containing protein, partial [Streptomyces sp. NPDC088847]